MRVAIIMGSTSDLPKFEYEYGTTYAGNDEVTVNLSSVETSYSTTSNSALSGSGLSSWSLHATNINAATKSNNPLKIKLFFICTSFKINFYWNLKSKQIF